MSTPQQLRAQTLKMASSSTPPQWQKGDLWDTDPNTFVAREAIKRLDLTQCYLTDDAIMKLLINKRERTITGINIFRFNEVEFVKNGFLRSRHKGRGAPALAPDGTVMTVMAGAHHSSTIVLNGGNSSLPAGSWSIENYQAKSDHPGYAQWLSKMKWTNIEALRAGIPPSSINATLTNPPKRAQQNISEPEKNKDGLREKKANGPDLKTEDFADEVQHSNAEDTANEGQDRIPASRSETPHEAPVEETPSEYATLSSTYSVITTSKPTTPEPSRPEADGSQVANFERAASEPGTPKAATPKLSRPEVDGSQVADTERAASEPATSKAVTPEPVIAHPITPDRAIYEPHTPDPLIPEPVALETTISQPVAPDRAVFEAETPEATISGATSTDITASEPTASEHSKAVGSEAMDLVVTGSEVLGSEAMGCRVARSEATGSKTAGSEVVAATSELANLEPIISGPTVSEVAASHPVVPKPVSSEPPALGLTISEIVSLETSASEPAPTKPTSEPEASNLVTSEVAGLDTVALKPAASDPTPEPDSEPASKPAPLKSFASISMQAKINSPEKLLPTSTPRDINTFLFQPEAQGPINSNMIQSQPLTPVRQQPPSPGPTLFGARPESTVGLGINTGLMQQTIPKTPASMFRQQYTPRQPSLEIPESPPSPARPTLRSEVQMPRGSNAVMPAARHNVRHSTTTQSGSMTKVTVSSFQTPPLTPSSTGSLKRKATEPL